MPVGPMDALSPIMADAQRPSINNGNTPATPKNPGKVSEMNDSDVVQKSPIGKDRSAVRQRKKCIVEHSSLRDSLTELEKCELSHWGLPEMVLMRYRQKGISSMFPWQSQCLTVGSVLEGKTMIGVVFSSNSSLFLCLHPSSLFCFELMVSVPGAQLNLRLVGNINCCLVFVERRDTLETDDFLVQKPTKLDFSDFFKNMLLLL